MRILLIKYRNIGDVLLSSALISNLRLHFPGSFIDFATNKDCVEMIEDNPDINNIFSYDREYLKKSTKLTRIIEEVKLIANLRKQKYDLVINLTEGERGAIMALFSNANNKLGFKIRKGFLSKIPIFDKLGNDKKNQHAVEKDLQFLYLLDKKPINNAIKIFWDKNIENDIKNFILDNNLQEFVHVHPVSRWMFKCWEDDRMAKVIDFLCIKKKYKVVITGSNAKSEINRIEKILSLCKSKPLNLSGKLSLKHLACLSSKSKFYFGVDSAPMHIAAATNSHVVSLMGASEASKWGPWSNNNKNRYSNNGIQENARSTIFANDDHSIFYSNGIKKCRGMTNISTDSVLKVLDENY